jgi:hypothetical protein
MSFDQTLTTQAKSTALAYLAENGLKMALYTADANLNADTLVYSTANEVVGAGYTAGGKALTGVTVNKSGTTAYLDFADVVWNPANFTARGALIYNPNLGDLAVAVLDFGSDKTATTSFTVQAPANTADAAIIRFT